MSTASAPADSDTDVVVVGCGPVGSTLSILLAQLGHSVTVLERWPQLYPLPRACHFDHEVGRIFQSCGIGDDLRAISEPADVYEWRNAAGTTLLRFGSPGDGPSGWPASSMFHQPALERLLDQQAADLGVDVRRGVTVTGVEPHADSVTVTTADGSSVTGRFLVGCDGANSTVRSLLDLPVTDLGFFYDWLIVDVVLNEPRVFDPINLQICDPLRPTTAVAGGPGRRRWEFMRLPDEPLDSLDIADRAWELLAPWDVHPGNAHLERHAVYTFNARYATQWRAGRVLLAGDAAHLMPPFAGQGMCAGVRDAANLSWKLGLVLDGAADEAILDTYQLERLPSAIAAIELSMALGKVICVPDPAEAAQRDAAMAAGVGDEPAPAPGLPDIGAGLIDLSTPHAGHQLVQGCDGDRRFDDAHGNGWRLVSIDPSLTAADLAGDEADWFASIGGRTVVLTDPDRTFQRWFAQHGTVVALQRPDFYLYGTATDAAGATALLSNLRHALTTGATT